MTALLKEPEQHIPNIHARRITDARWAAVASNLKRLLTESDAFKAWEVDAIVQVMVDVAKRTGGLPEDELYSQLHAKQFEKNVARLLAQHISRSYS